MEMQGDREGTEGVGGVGGEGGRGEGGEGNDCAKGNTYMYTLNATRSYFWTHITYYNEAVHILQ